MDQTAINFEQLKNDFVKEKRTGMAKDRIIKELQIELELAEQKIKNYEEKEVKEIKKASINTRRQDMLNMLNEVLENKKVVIKK